MKSTGKKILASVLSVILVLTTVIPIISFATQDDGSITVYLTVSKDGWFVNGDDADKTTLARVPIELEYFLLSDYGLEQFNRYESASFEEGGGYISDTVVEQPTMLHLLLKATEMFKLNGEKYDPSTNSDVLMISGSATSLFLEDFWGMGMNLNYYVDHEYPLMADGWGATADYILLEDGMEIDIAVFTNWYFYSDENSGFAYLRPAEKTVSAGETVDFQTWKTAQGGNYTTVQNKCEFLTTLVMNSDFQVIDQITGGAQNEGAFTYTFETPGTYYIAVLDENLSASNPSAGSEESRIAPGVSKIIVEAEDNGPEGKFVLVAESDEKLIIEPEWVYHGEDDTVYDALTSTIHTFDGINAGFLYSIDGVIFTPIMRTSDNGVYEFDKKASKVKNVFRFDTTGIPASENMVALLTAMADYNEKQEYKDNDNAAAVYAKIKAGYIGIDDETAKTYAKELRDALNAVDTLKKYKVDFAVTQADETVTEFSTEIYNDKGTKMAADEDGTYNLIAGVYDVAIVKDYNAVYGTITVTDSAYTVSAELPSGHHIEHNIYLSSAYSSTTEYASDTATGLLSSDFSSEQHEYTVYAPDTSTGLYINSTERSTWTSLENKAEYFVYHTILGNYEYGTLGYFGNGNRLTERLGGSLVGGVYSYGAGNEILITHEVECDNGFVQIQSYNIHIVRTRTLSDLSVHDSNGPVAVTNTSGTAVYSAYVLDSAETATVYPVIGGSYSGGYSITVNGTACEENGGVEVALEDTTTTVPVIVSHTDGSSNEYTVSITKTAAYESVVTVETEGASLVVTNAVGTEIAPEKVEGNVYTYQLVPGTTYTCTASKGANRTIFSFPAANIASGQFLLGKNVSLTVLEDNNWLSDLAFGTSSSSSNKGTLSLSSDFESTEHSYSLTLTESDKNPYIWATVNSAATFPATSQKINVVFTSLPTSSSKIGTETVTTTAVTSASTSGTKLANLNATYGTAVPFEVQVTSAVGSVTYMQVYTITPVVYPTIKSLTVEADGSALALDPAFDDETLSYTVSASELAKTFTVTAKLNRTINSLMINGKPAVSGQAAEVAMADIKNDTIPVTAVNGNGVEQTYEIKINKLPALDVSVTAEPSNAIIFITNDVGERVSAQADGTYKMLAGATYDYTVSCKDYIAQTGTFTVPESGEGFSVTLEKAPVNENINKDIDAAWPMFRGDNTNNGVVDSKTPKTADEAVLYWASKDGSGFDSNAIGCPIIVNDYLVYCTGNELHRMNRYTGEVDELKGTMVAKSSFNIIPPTYADGMIFVALSNGTIQAFNAETFESLWIYYDALGGQPNSPIVYQDGYIYTGFWTGETKNANFVCLSATDENPEETNETKTASWTYTQFGGFYWAGAYACDKFVLVGTDDGDSGYLKDTSNLLSFDAKTGELIGKIENLNGDIRSSVSYDEVTDRYYFTTKGGSFYSVAVNADGTFKSDENGVQGYDLKEIALYNYADDSSNPPMSTCTPVVHNGRAYIGVSGTSQFGAYSGHNITVIDLETWSIAYTVRTKGYPQTSGLLTTAYESEDGYTYVYFIDNYTPGQVRVIKDKPGVTEVVDGVQESIMSQGQLVTMTCAPVLFTPTGEHAQYAICSPISDENGTLYFKNDSAYMMAVGSKVESIEVTKQPDTTLYTVGDKFIPEGMEVTAHLMNGLDVEVPLNRLTYNESSNSFTVYDTEVTVYYSTVLYGDILDAENGNKTNVVMLPPEDYVPVTVLTAEQRAALDDVIAKIDAIGEVTLDSGDAIASARAGFDALELDVQDLVSNYQTLTDAEAEYAAIKNVYDKIEAVGEVTYEKAAAIYEADEAYNALTDEQKAKIINADVLESAKASLEAITAEINKVITQIDALGTVTMSKEADVAAARAAYEALPETSKAGVTNLDKLMAAEAVIAGLKGDIAKIEELINAIGEVTYEKKADVEAARAGYDALAEDSKAAVSNYAVLTEAEKTLAQLESSISAVEEKINAIGEVTVDKESEITAARAAYEALSEDLKAAVSNLSVLTEAEKSLANLKAEIKKAEDAISAIGEVSADKKSEIEAARAAYDALSESSKAAVSNYETLIASESELSKLLADISAVEEKIAALDEITVSKESEIVEARNAYEALPDASKALVKNLERLEKAEAILAGLKDDIKKVEELIDAIGEVTDDKKPAVEAARAAYDALGTDSREKVSNYAVLLAAESKFAQVYDAVAYVEAKINAIGTVLLSKEDKINEARAAYNSLSDEAKGMVSNYETLEKAERIFSILDFLFGWIARVFKFIVSAFENLISTIF